MRTLALVLAACVAAGSAGCVRVSRDPVTGNADIDVENPVKSGEDWKANITGRGMWTGASGTATARVEGGNTLVMLVLTGLPPGGPYPWHVHDGTCETGGPIVGDPAAYAPLTVGADGRAEANARLLNFKLNEAKKYHVNVHRSAGDLATIIACGQLDD
ncbi:MAG: superoxide dismutase family protein [Gemmatimonadota bacterium]|nr:superoxide dismutase family protein [Gemmatimonadota bacterium]